MEKWHMNSIIIMHFDYDSNSLKCMDFVYRLAWFLLLGIIVIWKICSLVMRVVSIFFYINDVL